MPLHGRDREDYQEDAGGNTAVDAQPLGMGVKGRELLTALR